MEIRYGNLAGKWFRQDLIDEVLVPLVETVERIIPEATDGEIWYDEGNDVHHLAFTVAGKRVDIRTYIRLSYSIDRKDSWVGCEVSQANYFVKSIRDRIFGNVHPAAVYFKEQLADVCLALGADPASLGAWPDFKRRAFIAEHSK